MIEEPTHWKPLLSRIFAGISTDWWAVIIGLTLARLVWIGAITSVSWPLVGLLK
jgi:hypothetical protein